jgi:four helix bundle protein
MERDKNSAAPFEFRERVLRFTKRVLELCKKLPNVPECKRIKEQLGASASSIGANYEEADGAVSKKDVRNKLGIARKEAKEALFFLQVIEGTYLKGIEDDVKEAEELVKILSSMTYKMKKN